MYVVHRRYHCLPCLSLPAGRIIAGRMNCPPGTSLGKTKACRMSRQKLIVLLIVNSDYSRRQSNSNDFPRQAGNACFS